MIVRSIDADNDWNFGKGKNDYVRNNAAIMQNIKTRLQSFLGDCFFDIPAGVDWLNLLGSKNVVALRLAIDTCILNTTGVTGFAKPTEVDFDHVTRLITITYSVNTVYTNKQDLGSVTNTSSFLLTESGDILTTEDGGGLEAG